MQPVYFTVSIKLTTQWAKYTAEEVEFVLEIVTRVYDPYNSHDTTLNNNVDGKFVYVWYETCVHEINDINRQ